MIRVREIDHVVLRVSSLDRALAFYRDVLGCTVEKRQEKIGLVQLRAGRSMIDLVPVDGPIGQRGGAAPGGGGRDLDHFCLRIDPFDEAAIRATLASHGVDAGPVATRYGAEGEGPSLYLHDPDGNLLELKGPPDRARPGEPIRLIGMLDSPYVRRVAVSLLLLGIDFRHEPLSVFRTMPAFAAINPVVKAPTLVCDDGTVLMDSTLILDHAESIAAGGRSLMPRAPDERRRALRILGLALAACEKAVQIVYERTLRPVEKQHAPWVERITGQLQAACDGLESELEERPLAVESATIGQDGVTAAVVWRFVQESVAAAVPAERYPHIVAHCAAAEALAELRAAPHGAGTIAPLAARGNHA
jgi:glutathione S-transferase/catechol 2,3-dioxygenase-like lactoylglutathione lyase family enzyme